MPDVHAPLNKFENIEDVKAKERANLGKPFREGPTEELSLYKLTNKKYHSTTPVIFYIHRLKLL